MTRQDDWITDRLPTADDANESAGQCVEVTYHNGMMGWEPFYVFKDGMPPSVVAWRPIRKAYPVKADGGGKQYGELLRKVVDQTRPNGLNGQCKVIPTDLVDEIRAALDDSANTKGT